MPHLLGLETIADKRFTRDIKSEYPDQIRMKLPETNDHCLDTAFVGLRGFSGQEKSLQYGCDQPSDAVISFLALQDTMCDHCITRSRTA